VSSGNEAEGFHIVQEDKKNVSAESGYMAKILVDELKNPPLSTQRKFFKELGIGENDGI
jgi:hypothetical protein